MILGITPERVEDLFPGAIFVFGSNLAGVHGAGAAYTAHQKYGAIRGQGFGLQGRSFAVPTKDTRLKSLDVEVIAAYAAAALRFMELYSAPYTWVWTKIGCGLAGHSPSAISARLSALFRESGARLFVPQEFLT